MTAVSSSLSGNSGDSPPSPSASTLAPAALISRWIRTSFGSRLSQRCASSFSENEAIALNSARNSCSRPMTSRAGLTIRPSSTAPRRSASACSISEALSSAPAASDWRSVRGRSEFAASSTPDIESSSVVFAFDSESRTCSSELSRTPRRTNAIAKPIPSATTEPARIATTRRAVRGLEREPWPSADGSAPAETRHGRRRLVAVAVGALGRGLRLRFRLDGRAVRAAWRRWLHPRPG